MSSERDKIREEINVLRTKYVTIVTRYNNIINRRRPDIHIRPIHIGAQPSPFSFVDNPDPNAYYKALRNWYIRAIRLTEEVVFSIEATPLTPPQTPRTIRKPTSSSHHKPTTTRKAHSAPKPTSHRKPTTNRRAKTN